MRKWILCVVALAVMAGGAGVLLRLKATQRLGEPGLKVSAVAGEAGRLQIELPARVLSYQSSNIPPTEVETRTLPQDTTLAKRLYRAPDGFQLLASAVLMGTDRTSIHKPEYCLTSQGWSIVSRASGSVRVERPRPYDLPIRRFTASIRGRDSSGRTVEWSGVYVFWFVSENKLTSSHWTRVGWITWELIRRGVLPRWAYVSCFATCPPGEEDATFGRLREFIEASVPEFQAVSGLGGGA
ncbi:MAG TPA: exosortase-associated EpsI family protein [Verrucomicrobiota bacterium]|nr:exosortase-associated EpsI family protein [Verrucomicrobiota bacterium]HNU50641.1 exosortase-associated EpsI family protein [Verrucomicrobiota bacterium]